MTEKQMLNRTNAIHIFFLQHGFVLLDNSTLEVQPVMTEALTSTDDGAPHIVRRVPIPHSGAGNVTQSYPCKQTRALQKHTTLSEILLSVLLRVFTRACYWFLSLVR